LLIVVDVDYVAGKDERPDEKLVENVETRMSEIEFNVVLEVVEENKNCGKEASIILLFLINRIVKDDEENSVSEESNGREDWKDDA
jgi:hypothetical protein